MAAAKMEKSPADLLTSPGVSSFLKSLKLKTKQQELLIRVTILGLIYNLAFITRLFSVLRYESMIHEFDPYFNYRVTQYLTKNGFYAFWNWFDSESWYPLGRIVGGTLYPVLMVTAAFIFWTLRFIGFAVHIREHTCVLLAPFFASFQKSALIIGVHDRAEKDEIVKSVMHLKHAEIEEGYTKDAVISRQDLLMDVRDKLLFEPEYAGNFKDKQPPKSSLKIPWALLPGALCLLQEVGNEKLVLEIGQKALQHPESKPFVHDLLLSMALAECAIAKFGFEKNSISQGFEALARAQCLLRSKISLGKVMMLSQIEESLEELAPACTLDILCMPHTPENAERRLGAIAALRELLRQGLDVESSCQVEDWSCFLNQALRKLMATEIVELISWDSLALTRKNRKSLESQNQRVVIDFNSFYLVLLAHIALGFSGKQADLWQALANAAKERSCFWKFVLLQLNIVHADILIDAIGREMAEIEVLLEEAAELVDDSQPKNPTYYSPYKICYLLKRQDDGSWRFCDGDILTPQ